MEDKYFEGGWIKLYQSFKNSPIYEDSYLVHLFIHCLLKASWKEREVIMNNQVIQLNRGQFITGRKQLVRDLTGLKDDQTKEFQNFENIVRRKLVLLEKLGILTIKPTNKYSVITIQNWDRYQVNDQQPTINLPTDDHKQDSKDSKDINNTNVLLSDPSGTDSVDDVNFKISTPKKSTSYVQEIGQYYEKITGAKIVNWGRAGREIKAMKEAYTLEDIKWAIDKLWENEWWKEKGITLTDVMNQLPKLMSRTIMYGKKGQVK